MITDVFTIPFPWVETEEFTRSESISSDSPTVRQFIGGPENRLVQVAFDAISKEKSHLNPLILFGSPGVGKSHIAVGLLSLLKQQNPNASYFKLTGGDYVRQYSLAADFEPEKRKLTESAASNKLRKQLERVDCLLFENLHELANFPNAQESLAQQLDLLQQRNVTILITCLDHPTQDNRFSERLTSRLSQGYLVPVALPGTVTKEVMLRQLAHLLGIDLTAVAAKRLAESFPYPLPRLKSLLLDISLHIPDNRIDSETVRRFIHLKHEKNRPPLQSISTLTARYYRIKTADLKSASRRQSIVQARSAAMYLARKLTGQSFQIIGKHFGGRDHTTVMHAINRIYQVIDTDYALRESLKELEAIVTRQTNRSPS